MGNCGFGIVPPARAPRLLCDTLGRSRDETSPCSKDWYEWPFETFPEYLSTIEAPALLVNRRHDRPHAAALLRDGRRATERAATPDDSGYARPRPRGIDRGHRFRDVEGHLDIGACGKLSRAVRLTSTEVRRSRRARRRRPRHVQATVGRELFLDEFEALHRARAAGDVDGAAVGDGGIRGTRNASRDSRASARSPPPDYDRSLKVLRPLNFEFQFASRSSSSRSALHAGRGGLRRQVSIYADPEFRRAFRELGQGAQRGIAAKWDSGPWIACPTRARAREAGAWPAEPAFNPSTSALIALRLEAGGRSHVGLQRQ